MKFEYPLLWPVQQPRTEVKERSRFGKISPYRAGEDLFIELERLGVENLVISTNLKQHLNGKNFYADQRVDDVGVAIYFDMKGASKVMACDKWDKVEHNIRAITLSIEAIRGLERWGGSEFLDGLFTGFKALPQKAGEDVHKDVHYFDGIDNMIDLKNKFRKLARELHPDMPNGDLRKFVTMKAQYEDLSNRIG